MNDRISGAAVLQHTIQRRAGGAAAGMAGYISAHTHTHTPQAGAHERTNRE